MKKIIVLIFLAYSFNSAAQRYLTEDFPVLDSIIGGIYGSAVNYQSNNQELLFDFYEPANDVIAKRPLLIYLHGGGFTTGTRLYPSVQLICRRMAKKGYAVANIDYRIDPNFEFYNSTTDRRAMTDAMHDAKQAIRYFKANASTYRIDTSLIFIGGESAGAVTSMMASFVDKQSEMNVYPMSNPNNPVGNSSNSNVGNQVKGTLCLCGTIIDTLAMELPTDPSILWIHSTDDGFVPLSFAQTVVTRANNIGIPIETKIYQGGVHCPWYFGNANWSSYLDSTIVYITDFLYPQVSTTVSVNKTEFDTDISIYPNPFHSEINIDFNRKNLTRSGYTIKLLSAVGELIYEESLKPLQDNFSLNLEYLNDGYYFLEVKNERKKIVRKIVKN